MTIEKIKKKKKKKKKKKIEQAIERYIFILFH